MQRSTERLLTTHIGSLPRPADLRELLLARDQGQAYDVEAFDRSVPLLKCFALPIRGESPLAPPRIPMVKVSTSVFGMSCAWLPPSEADIRTTAAQLVRGGSPREGG